MPLSVWKKLASLRRVVARQISQPTTNRITADTMLMTRPDSQPSHVHAPSDADAAGADGVNPSTVASVTSRREAHADGSQRPRLQHWHRRQLELGDGDVLRWAVIARPIAEPFIAFYRRDRVGGIHDSEGLRLLKEHGNPDAEFGLRGDSITTR